MMEAWTSPVMPKMTELDNKDSPLHRPITAYEESWMGSLLCLGAAVGPFPAAFAADYIGRKNLLATLCLPMAVSFCMLLFVKSVTLYYVSRILGGVAIGGIFSVLPTYIAEVSHASIRGVLSSTMNIFEVSGFMLSYMIGPFISVMWFNVVCMVVPCLAIMVIAFMPETPYFYVAKNKMGDAESVLKKLRKNSGDSDVKEEMEIIKDSVEKNMSVRFVDIFKTASNIRALVMSLSLVSFQQLSGVNIIVFYTQDIFQATGSSTPAAISAIIMGGVQVAASFVTLFIVDRLGRRILLIISAVGMLVSETILGAYFYLHTQNASSVESFQWLPILCLVIYIVAFNFGFGPLPWTVMSEIFPDNVKAIATSLTTSICWLLSFILTAYFHDVSEHIGMSGSFWAFSGFNLLAVFYTYFFIPETKGKTFQEIQKDLQR